MIDITKQYRTRDGRDVRLISDQGSESFPIVGYVGDHVTPSTWRPDGRSARIDTLDLIEVKEPKILKCWVNFYGNLDQSVFPTKSLADHYNEVRGYPRIGEAVEVTKLIEEK